MKDVPRGQLALRRRTPWEAMDAGLALWRVNAAQILLPNILVTLALVTVVRLALPRLPWIAWILPFFLRPLIDHLVIHVLSVREFNPEARDGALWKGLSKILFTGLLGDLLWRRFDWRRGINIPLRVLERRKGRAFRSRRKTLARGGSSWATITLLIWASIECGLIFGLASFTISIMSISGVDLFSNSWDDFISFFRATEPVFLSLYVIIVILAETLMASSCFAIYLNARVETEGWDLRFAFEALVQGRQKRKKNKGAGLLAALILSMIGLFCPALPARAADAPIDSLKQVLDSRDFGRTEPGWDIEQRDWTKKKLDPDKSNIFAPWLEMAQIYSAFILRAVIALVIAGLAIWFTVWYLRRRTNGEKTLQQGNLRAGTFSKKEYIQARNLLEEACSAAEAGNDRQALSALRELAPLLLALNWNSIISPDATEQDCIRQARRALSNRPNIAPLMPARPHDSAHNTDNIESDTSGQNTISAKTFLDGFEFIMNEWVKLAWAHRDIERGNLDEAISWSRYWSRGGDNAS